MLENYRREGFDFRIESVDKMGFGERLNVFVKIPKKYGWIERVRVCFKTFGREIAFAMNFVKEDDLFAYFEGDVTLNTCSLYHFYFSFEANGNFYYYKKENYTGDRSVTNEECWRLSIGFSVPEWAKGAIMYHIFVDRYRKGKNTKMIEMPKRVIHEIWDENPVLGPDENGNWNIDFFGGNLKGIEESLDYIKSFGVSIIYLSPIARSQSNHRYDTADYEVVDPYAGTNEELKKLCEAVHRKEMHIIIDGVFNHTGDDSKYFNRYGTYSSIGAYQSKESEYYPFYKRRWVNGHENFDYWWGMENLPVCDGHNEYWRKYILGEDGIIDKWMKLGFDGVRLDVADELYDDFLEELRIAVHRNKPDGFIIGEVWKNPMRMNRGYISSGKCMDSVMNYQLVDALIRYYKYCDVWKIKEKISEIVSEYPEGTIHTLMNFTSTHDISRLIEMCSSSDFKQHNSEWGWNLIHDNLDWIKNHKLSRAEYVHGKKILKSYISALCFMPGIFSIFYGDEVGLTGIGNLLNRKTYPWGKRDKDLLKFFRNICKIRNKNAFLRTADVRVLEVDETKIMYERYTDSNEILVVASRSHRGFELHLPEKYKNAEVIFSLPKCTKEYLCEYGAVVLKNK